MWGVRVKIEPRIEDILGFRTVLHAKLRLLQRGPRGSQASTDDKPAELVFHAAYLDRVRGATLSFKRFARLAGSLRFDRDRKLPRFECDPTADFSYDEPPPEGDEPVRRVSLTYDDLTFRRAPKGDAPAAKLRLPKDPEGARFLEIGVGLEIGGATEVAQDDDDRLDIPLGPIERLDSTLPRDQLHGVAKIMSSSHFAAWLTTIYGHDIPDGAYRGLRRQLLAGGYRMPPIEIVSSLPEDNVAGYDRDVRRIKIVRTFIKESETDPERAAELMAALIEEFGHFVDDDLRNRLSKTGGDAALDEGAVFSYVMANLRWDETEEASVAKYLRDGDLVELRVKWPVYKQSIDRVAGPEEQRSDTMAGAIEFFGAGRGRKHSKPGTSFAHESIEDALPSDETGATGFTTAQRLEIYFGNWLRDFSQLLVPKVFQIMIASGTVADAFLPGSTAAGGTRLKSDPRGVLTDMLDIYARAHFADVPQFRVTRARIGVYRSWEHIDNPDGIASSALDSEFDPAPSAAQLSIDSSSQVAAYITGRFTLPVMSAAQYMRGELSAALAAGPTAEGRRRLGQGLHTLEDFFSHTNFVELFLRKAGQTTVEPWVPQLNEGGRKFFPLVSGKFGGDDTAASIALGLAEVMEDDLKKICEAGKRAIGVQMALILLRDLRPHMAKQAEGLLDDLEGIKKSVPFLFTIPCKTIGLYMRFLHFLFGAVAHILANQIDEAQTLIGGAPTINPTHTQIAKDHDDHPLHALAANCARVAVGDIGRLMFDAWKGPAGAPGVPTESQILNTAESYFVHPDLIALPPQAGLAAITKLVEAFASDPANAANIKRASTRTPNLDELREVQRKAQEITKGIPIERLKKMFGF